MLGWCYVASRVDLSLFHLECPTATASVDWTSVLKNVQSLQKNVSNLELVIKTVNKYFSLCRLSDSWALVRFIVE